MRVDVHAHYWAESYLDALAAAGRPDLGHARQADDLDQRLRTLDETGVDVQVFSAIGLNTEVQDPFLAMLAAQHMNNLYVDITAKYNGRFRGFASIPLPHLAEAIAETDRALTELGLLGVGLPCIIDGKPIDHPDFEPFWQNLARHSAVVYVHPVGSDSLSHAGLGDFHLNMALGSPLQIAMAPLRIGLSGLSTRYPQLRFIFALGGGVLPYLWTRYETNLRRGLTNSALAAVGSTFFAWMKDLPLDPSDPMSIFRKFWYDTSVQDIPGALRDSKATFGADRLLLGSDAIFASLPESIKNIQSSPDLTEHEKSQILDQSAAEILGLTGISIGRRAS